MGNLAEDSADSPRENFFCIPAAQREKKYIPRRDEELQRIDRKINLYVIYFIQSSISAAS
jgi:hypothetical protein